MSTHNMHFHREKKNIYLIVSKAKSDEIILENMETNSR